MNTQESAPFAFFEGLPAAVQHAIRSVSNDGLRLARQGGAATQGGGIPTGSAHLQNQLVGQQLMDFANKVARGTPAKEAVEEAINHLTQAIAAANAGQEAKMRMYAGVGDAQLWDAFRRIRDAYSA